MKIIILIIYLSPVIISLVLIIQFIKDLSRHKRVMKLIEQADVIHSQCTNALKMNDLQSAEFHLQRYIELSEMIKNYDHIRKRK